jgi:hypothetical protein
MYRHVERARTIELRESLGANECRARRKLWSLRKHVSCELCTATVRHEIQRLVHVHRCIIGPGHVAHVAGLACLWVIDNGDGAAFKDWINLWKSEK